MINLQHTKTNSYLPLQPEFEILTDYYLEHKERNKQNQSTILFYQFKMKKDMFNVITVIPDGCIDILFCCNEKAPFANVCGSVLQTKSINLHADNEYFGVRFMPNQETHKMNYSMKEIIDKEVPLLDMVSLDSQIVERLISERNFLGKINLFNETIRKFIFNVDSSSKAIEYALHNIYMNRGNITMIQLAKEMGYSTRYLRKQFEEHVGISPKLFSQIVRFQSSISMLLKINHCTLKDVIMENGYYDQAHIINDFKNFGYMTPNKFTEKFSAGYTYSSL
ncbi:helix-turn-helix domain-containing protein [Peribacillus simplex]|uniref:helix-turn-helix domain-containing protein n=1 Tax=Peribacillus simplex TaxID=1478 RepID=UPI0024C1C963|nr:helix-turn-helix domain-containing protein [Peribacillus simplex]WHY58423.1 helix-turn-helix domain-containing protein [Peribacillus simplex]